MSQPTTSPSNSDYDVANATGANFRGDLNNILDAILTMNSGSSAPAYAKAYTLFADTNAGIMKMRNGANDGFINLFTLTGGVDVDAASNFNEDVTFTGASANIVFDKSADDLIFNDNAKAVFGTSSDGLEIFHDASDSIINDNGTGSLKLQLGGATKAEVVSGGLTVTDTLTATTLAGTLSTAAQTNVTSLGTLTGLTLSGDMTFTGASANIVFDKSDNQLEFADNAKAEFGTNGDLEIYCDGTDQYIDGSLDSSSGNLIIRGDDVILKGSNDTVMAKFQENASVQLYRGGTLHLETTSVGIHTTKAFVIGASTTRVAVSGSNGGIQLQGDSGVETGMNFIRNLNGSGGPEFRFAKSRNVGDTDVTIVQEGDTLGQFVFCGADGTDFVNDSARIRATAAGTIAENTVPGKIIFSTTATGDSSPTDRFSIDHQGFVLIPSDSGRIKLGADSEMQVYHNGTDSFVTTSTGTLKLRPKNTEDGIIINPDGAVELYHDDVPKLNTTGSGITVQGSVTETSDIALKENIQPLSNVLDKVKQLTGYKYNFKNTKNNSMGVIAQDVEKVFPELVHGDEGQKTLQYSGLIGALVESVKELSAKVAALEAA